MDNDRIDIGYIETGLDDGRRNQDLDLAVDEIHHDLLQGRLRHLPVGVRYRSIRHQFPDAVRERVYVLDAVIHIVDLAVARQFAVYGLAHQFVLVLADIGLDGHAVAGRLRQHRHVADADQAHVQRTRDGCCGQCQHVHLLFHLLNALLMCHAEALLLVDDEQTQILKLYVRRKNAVGTDDDIDQTLL